MIDQAGSITDRKPPIKARRLTPPTKPKIFRCLGLSLILRTRQTAGMMHAMRIPDTPPIIP